MWTAPLCALLLQHALVVVAALAARRAKLAALLLGVAAFTGAPWLAGTFPLVRGLVALVGGIGLLRVIDVVRLCDREKWSPGRRVLHVLSFVDSRTVRRDRPRIDLSALGRMLLWGLLAAAGFWVARSSSHVVRWGGGLVLTYAAIESGYAWIGASYRALGFVAPRLHVWPIASLSVGELWGKRWARPVSTWLRETCFRPLARRGHPTMGLLFGFVASALGHAYPVVVAVGLSMAASMFAFFLVQGVVVVLEARLGATRWPRPARRAWTVTIMVVSSPLFVEPALRVLGC